MPSALRFFIIRRIADEKQNTKNKTRLLYKKAPYTEGG